MTKAFQVVYPTSITQTIFNSNPCRGNKATTEASHIYEARLSAHAGHQATKIHKNHQKAPTAVCFFS